MVYDKDFDLTGKRVALIGCAAAWVESSVARIERSEVDDSLALWCFVLSAFVSTCRLVFVSDSEECRSRRRSRRIAGISMFTIGGSECRLCCQMIFRVLTYQTISRPTAHPNGSSRGTTLPGPNLKRKNGARTRSSMRCTEANTTGELWFLIYFFHESNGLARQRRLLTRIV